VEANQSGLIAEPLVGVQRPPLGRTCVPLPMASALPASEPALAHPPRHDRMLRPAGALPSAAGPRRRLAPQVDITPQLPIQPYTASPADPGCESEAVVLCSNGHIKGQQVGASKGGGGGQGWIGGTARRAL
jgi:hypothetical protein